METKVEEKTEEKVVEHKDTSKGGSISIKIKYKTILMLSMLLIVFYYRLSSGI